LNSAGVLSATKTSIGLGNVANIAQVTTVTGTLPIVSSGGTTPDISIAAATASVDGYMTKEFATKLDGIATNANLYVHPTGDGNSHIPATSTNNVGKFLQAGATENTFEWSDAVDGGTF
jgi:hypothetical protein